MKTEKENKKINNPKDKNPTIRGRRGEGNESYTKVRVQISYIL
jgi:hypothetical protein